MVQMALKKVLLSNQTERVPSNIEAKEHRTTALLAWIIPIEFVIPSIIVDDQKAKSRLGNTI